MVIERPAFTTTTLEEDRPKEGGRIISVRMNKAELKRLERAGRLLQQEKPATVIKQLMELGQIVLQDPQMGKVMRVVLKNIRKNDRVGISYADPQFSQK